MFLHILKSKIHCATVTEANLHYMGSITIDEELMEAAGLMAGEQVHVVNNSNGERIETYVITGERHSGCICLNGAAASWRGVYRTLVAAGKEISEEIVMYRLLFFNADKRLARLGKPRKRNALVI